MKALVRLSESSCRYDGPNARRLWQAIYDENCFLHHEQDMCFEERVFFRLLSGLQSSINTHIALTVNEGEPSLRMWKGMLAFTSSYASITKNYLQVSPLYRTRRQSSRETTKSILYVSILGAIDSEGRIRTFATTLFRERARR